LRHCCFSKMAFPFHRPYSGVGKEENCSGEELRTLCPDPYTRREKEGADDGTFMSLGGGKGKKGNFRHRRPCHCERREAASTLLGVKKKKKKKEGERRGESIVESNLSLARAEFWNESTEGGEKNRFLSNDLGEKRWHPAKRGKGVIIRLVYLRGRMGRVDDRYWRKKSNTLLPIGPVKRREGREGGKPPPTKGGGEQCGPVANIPFRHCELLPGRGGSPPSIHK